MSIEHSVDRLTLYGQQCDGLESAGLELDRESRKDERS